MGSLISAIVFKSGQDKITEVPPSDLWSITAIDIDGQERVLKEFLPNKKAFIFVNVASS